MIDLQHLQEWRASGVDDDITYLNVRSLSGNEAYEAILYALPDTERRNDGRLRDGRLRQYSHLYDGGWFCGGVDAITFEDTPWGCLKSNKPRVQEFKGFGDVPKIKTVKYEHPVKVATEIFCLRVTWKIGLLIAKNQGVEDLYVERFQRLVAEENKGSHATGEGELYSGIDQQRMPPRDGEGDSRVTPLCEDDQERYSIPESALELEDEGFWQWVISTPQIKVIVTEGCKKAGSLLTAGYCAIALPGIYGGYRQPKDDLGNKTGLKHLIPQLEVFAVEGREFYFCFDNDKNRKTIQNVRTAIANTSKLLIKRKCTVKIIEWRFPEKGVDDLIFARGRDCFDLLYETALSFGAWQNKGLVDISPYVSKTVCKQYLDASDINPPDDAVIVGIKAFKGANKTGSLAEYLQKFIDAGNRLLGVVHRQQLAGVNADRFGVDFLNDMKKSLTKGLLGYFLCHHSLHAYSQAKFDVESWDKGIAVFDEIEQVIWDLLDSSLIREFRILIIETLQEVLQNIVKSGGKIYVMDADLSPISLNFLYYLLGEKVKTWVLHNTYIPTERKRHLYVYGNPNQLVSKAIDAVKKGQKVIIHTSGQRHKSKFGTTNLEALFNKECFGKNILRIDGKTIRDPHHAAFGCIGDDLNKQLQMYDVVICSPSLETGVSIDIRGHFNAVFGIALGVQTVNSFCQTIERVREDVPRHIFVADRGLPSCFVGNGSTDIKGLLASQHQAAKANINVLTQLGGEIESECFDSPLLTWAKFGVLINEGMRNYKQSILDKLENDGYEILEPIDDDEILNLTETITDSRDKIYEEHCHAIPAAIELSSNEFEQLQNKQSRTEQESLAEKKYQLKRNYGIQVTAQLVMADDDGLSSQLKLLYYSTVGREHLPARDKKALAKLTEYSDGKLWKPDLNKRVLGTKVKFVELFLSQFLESDRTFVPSELQDWQSKLMPQRFAVKALVGVTIKEDSSPIRTANALLQPLGLKLSPTGEKRGAKGQQEKVYKLVSDIKQWSEQIFPVWLERDASQNVSSSDTVVQKPYINITTEVCTTNTVCTTSQITTNQETESQTPEYLTVGEVEQCAESLRGVDGVGRLLETIERYGRKICTEAETLLEKVWSRQVRELLKQLKKQIGDEYQELPA
ncbi:MAG: plasmid replication protein, CyRepA1 family [Crinalium sp.]